MGGKMNLNPLKKDDNTDALVKALEDANTMDGANGQATDQTGANVSTPDANMTPDSAAIAADPQVASAGVMTSSDDVAQADAMAVLDSSKGPLLDGDKNSDDSATGIAFSGNDLPAGLSSDADAHLPSGGTGDNSELDSVKNSALEQLRPLIEKLDLEPADKFDKYLMMLRASDDPALIKPAFDAAQAIEGEKEKAQALLDIINEINYITSSQQTSSS
ncbi:hypothetical protein H6800_02465 [Candidatus Nomurabacteria bacterium]|nr:hypothetical protein [Candidatus Nomurabacteria bacterium]